ncbi:DUF4330 family protein [Ructibacterium gallinarum]|uniref:DUF4330 domain-containing protein n=1 Tax=Ructibacterium gallinarum TaxID=2779355 RepID=A0A9D5LZ04_9FIRM|nr:DUF4330 family protein [Ructibacterium gallinarum]MBE5040636.1 hypothetical protein [Ructibacterium gallinarum]
MNKKIFWRFNIIDLILIAVIVLSLIALLYKVTQDAGEEELHFYRLTYICQEAPKEIFEGISPGIPCADGDYGTPLGNIESVDTDNTAPTEGFQKAIFISVAEGRKADHGIMIGDVLYLKGKYFNLMAGDSIFSVYLSAIEPVPDPDEE